ncbi:hypothetical protein DL96DRAFT_1825614 [Flagelloscypha sp. PMI_526]|nr:hypothetical protein DL96DRAFT_1825614 [Flagelloscypha sp. PMI_526]
MNPDENLLASVGENDNVVSSDLIALITQIGPKLHSFRIESLEYNHAGEALCLRWSGIGPWFLSTIFDHVIPFIHTLELIEVTLVPLLHILARAPRLRNITLSSVLDPISGICEYPLSVVVDIPKVIKLDLTLWAFISDDLETGSHLGQLMQDFGKNISTLELRTPLDVYFPGIFDYFYKFEDLQGSLRVLFVGSNLYHRIVSPVNVTDVLHLEKFKNLQVLTLAIAVPKNSSDWMKWFDWLGICLKSERSIPKSLRILRFSVAPNGFWDYKTIPFLHMNFNSFASSSRFSLEFVASRVDGHEKNEVLFAMIRSCLRPWEEAGKLSFFVDLS